MTEIFSCRTRTTCRICGSTDVVQYLDLTDQPPSNSFIRPDQVSTEQRFPLTVQLCQSCGLSQLMDIVSSENIFDDYAYLSSTSRALCNHYQGLVDDAVVRFNLQDGALVADIGCNDGVMLARYPADRFRLLGIEPSSAGDYAEKAGFQVVRSFFDRTLAPELVQRFGHVDLVTTTNVFAHVDDTEGFALGAASWLAPDGVWIIEFPYLVDMVESCYFDTIYHEHLCYLALTPLMHLFSRVGLRAFRVERVEVGASGPALRLFVCRTSSSHDQDPSIEAILVAEAKWGIKDLARYQAFALQVSAVRDELRALLADLKAKDIKVAAFCAPAKGNTLLNYLEATQDTIFAVSDNNELKIGKLTPGTHIPVISDQELLDSGARYALLLAWNYADFFVGNAEFIKRGGRFIVPLPHPVVRP